MNLHPKIKELKLKTTPYTNRAAMAVGADGKLVDSKLEVTDTLIKGYCCVWGVRDDRGTGWVKGCFSKAIRERGPDSSANNKIVGLWQHVIKDPIGKVVKLVEDDYGLYFEIECDPVPSGERALIQVRSGTINQFSFGFGEYLWDQMYYDSATDTVWIKESKLEEISAVTFASMEDTYAVRSKEDYEEKKLTLDEETDAIINSLPRANRMEIRQLISSHISLVRAEPAEIRSKLLESPEPVTDDDVIDLSLITKKSF